MTRLLLLLVLLQASPAFAQPNATWRGIEASASDRGFWERHHGPAIWVSLTDGQDVSGSPGWEWQQDASGLWGTQLRAASDCQRVDPYRDYRRALACRAQTPTLPARPVFRLGALYQGPYPDEVMQVIGLTRDDTGVEVVTAKWLPTSSSSRGSGVFAFTNEGARFWVEVRPPASGDPGGLRP